MIGASCEYCEESYETADGLIADSRGYFCDDFCRGAFTELEESDKLRAELAQAREQLAQTELERKCLDGQVHAVVNAIPDASRVDFISKLRRLVAERDALRAELAMLRRDSARPSYSESEMVQKLTAERDELQRQLAEMTAERDAIRGEINRMLLRVSPDQKVWGRWAYRGEDGEVLSVLVCECRPSANYEEYVPAPERDELKRQLAEIREAWEHPHRFEERWLDELDRAIRGSEEKQ